MIVAGVALVIDLATTMLLLAMVVTCTCVTKDRVPNRTVLEIHLDHPLVDDGVVDPVQTRDVLGLGLAMSLNAPIPPVRYGIHRM